MHACVRADVRTENHRIKDEEKYGSRLRFLHVCKSAFCVAFKLALGILRRLPVPEARFLRSGIGGRIAEIWLLPDDGWDHWESVGWGPLATELGQGGWGLGAGGCSIKNGSSRSVL